MKCANACACADSASELEVTVHSVSMVVMSVHAVNSMEQLGHSLQYRICSAL